MHLRLIVCSVALLCCRATLACTLCQTPISQEVRQVVLGHDLWFYVCVSALPFLALLVIAVLIHGPRVR
jgi:hypothetical protein